MEQITKDLIVVLKRAELGGFYIDCWWLGNDTLDKIYLNPDKFSTKDKIEAVTSDCLYNLLFFDHEFAQAYYGAEQVCRICGYDKEDVLNVCRHCRGYVNDFVPAYLWHMKQIVCCVMGEEKLKYIKTSWRGVKTHALQ